MPARRASLKSKVQSPKLASAWVARWDAGSETGGPRKVAPGFHAQVVDFPHIQVRNSECGVRNVTQSLGRLGPLRAAWPNAEFGPSGRAPMRSAELPKGRSMGIDEAMPFILRKVER
jgi:hypothetical protein